MKNFSIGLPVLVCLLVLPVRLYGYSLHSGLTEGCHERITRSALLNALPSFEPDLNVPIPESALWREFSEGIIRANRLKDDFPQLEDAAFRLMFVSVIIGVRSPDTEGHAITNLTRLRQIHADPDASGQYAHALRGPRDDGASGDIAAVEGTRRTIIDLVIQSFESRRKSPQRQIITAPLYFDFYGLVDIEVWEPAYLLGRALHALQDSFSHTIRSDDLTRILHVLNYVDAIAGHLNERKDGLPHSDFMDTCDGDTAPIAMTASQASVSLIVSVNRAIELNAPEPVKLVLDEWLLYEPGCTLDNDYCDSGWAALARRDQTGPYLKTVLGCNTTGAKPPIEFVFIVALMCTLGLLRCRRLATVPVASFLLVLCIHTNALRAEVFVQLDSHVSLLSDVPERSIIANTFGGGIRGGYGFGSWRVLGHVERNYWISTELTDRTTPGVLNLGVGVQHLSAGGFVRSGVVLGPSILVYDTAFDDRGTMGVFLDLRPVELAWSLNTWLGLYLNPLSFTYVSPALKEPPIRLVLYRTNFGMEFRF